MPETPPQESFLDLLLDLLSLAPDRVWHAMAMLSFLFMVNYLVRTAYMSEATRSVTVHVFVFVLTFVPAIVLAAILLWAGYSHPDRVWVNLGLAALLFIPWGLGGAITRLGRPDTEGADIGAMAAGALLTFSSGLLAALIFG